MNFTDPVESLPRDAMPTDRIKAEWNRINDVIRGFVGAESRGKLIAVLQTLLWIQNPNEESPLDMVKRISQEQHDGVKHEGAYLDGDHDHRLLDGAGFTSMSGQLLAAKHN